MIVIDSVIGIKMIDIKTNEETGNFNLTKSHMSQNIEEAISYWKDNYKSLGKDYFKQEVSE